MAKAETPKNVIVPFDGSEPPRAVTIRNGILLVSSGVAFVGRSTLFGTSWHKVVPGVAFDAKDGDLILAVDDPAEARQDPSVLWDRVKEGTRAAVDVGNALSPAGRRTVALLTSVIWLGIIGFISAWLAGSEWTFTGNACFAASAGAWLVRRLVRDEAFSSFEPSFHGRAA